MRRWLSGCLALLMSCSEGPQPATRLLLDWWPNPVHIPLFVASEKGFFRDEGLHIEILNTSEPPQALLFLSTGRADVVLHSAPNTLQAFQNNPELRWTGCLIDRPLRALLCLKSEALQSAADLNGKVLGGNPEGLLTAYIHSAMKAQGIQFRQIQKISWDAPTALLTKAVDVVAGVYWNIEPLQMASVGIETTTFPIEQFGVPDYDELILVTTAEKIRAQPSLRRGLVKALQISCDWCRQHPEEAFALYTAAVGPKSGRVQAWEREAWLKTVALLPVEQQPDCAKWNRLAIWMAAYQLTCPQTDISGFLGSGPLPPAVIASD